MAVSANARISVPYFDTDEIQHRRALAQWAREVNQGHLQNTGNVTLAAGAATTVVTDLRVGAFSFIGFMPTTANAAAEIGAGAMYVSSRSAEAFTITHANNAQVDRTFVYCILG